MSASDRTGPLSSTQRPALYSPRAGKKIAGVSAQTIRARGPEPDAWLISEDGQKRFPLFTEATLAAYAAGRETRGGAE
jgi:hypothetical protein